MDLSKVAVPPGVVVEALSSMMVSNRDAPAGADLSSLALEARPGP